jgi:choline kinase
MKNKVCILAAGVGSQLQELSKNIATAILPVNFKASISYIIEKFDINTEIVIAVGHKKETVIDYLTLAYPERKFIFVEIDKYMGPGASAGRSLLKCREHLQCPFVYFTADTIVVEDIPKLDENWIGVAPTKEPEKYCTVKIKNNLVYQMNNRTSSDNKLAFIGVSGIKDFEIFWSTLEKGTSESSEEDRQVNSFKALVNRKLVPKTFTWFDTGSLEKYIETNNSFIGGEASFDFSKNDEFLYFVNTRVIKFFENSETAKKRVERATLLDGLCPKIEGYRNNFYSYKKIEGNTLYEVINPQILNNLLHWSDKVLWKRKNLNTEEKKKFKKVCKDFYFDKTLSRINDFYKKNNIQDNINIINGIQVPTLKELMEKIDWENLFEGIPSRFHGDFTVGNILVSRDNKTNLDKFTLIDWRHDFAGSLDLGDIYYDLAKLYKGIFLSDDLIKKNMFSFEMSGNDVYYEYFHTRRLIEAREEYDLFLEKSEFDSKKVKIISAICLLNMSPLHNYPFNFLVYFLGKNMLNNILNKNGYKETK